MTDLVFTAFNSWHMAILCLTVAGIHLYRSFVIEEKCVQRRIKAGNWAAFGAVFVVNAIVGFEIIILRTLLRMMLGLLVISEIAYYSDVISDMLSDLVRRVRKGRLSNGFD